MFEYIGKLMKRDRGMLRCDLVKFILSNMRYVKDFAEEYFQR